MKKYDAPSVKKAFAILSAISSFKEGMGVSDLAKKLKMAKRNPEYCGNRMLRVKRARCSVWINQPT